MIDCDTYKNPELENYAEQIDNDSVPVQSTPRGGKHFIFRKPENVNWGISAGKIAPGIDTRTNNSYIAVHPSTVDGNGYSWSMDLPTKDQLPEPPAWLQNQLTFLFSDAAKNISKKKYSFRE
ncbi:MAG: bifunctional DNA primase/polymerase [Planctomycetaceae bacterium]|nr:bifunctional DNA primase/polymerase [Planctomycetaceae bacterium]